VAGSTSLSSDWFIDPEPLIPFSLDVARQDPRVFDEILDWLLKNSEWINVKRLVSLLRADGPDRLPLMQAVAETITSRQPNSRWKQMSSMEQDRNPEPKPLFSILGRPWEPGTAEDSTFLAHGFRRSPVSTRGMSHEVTMANPRCLVFKTRSLFGVTIRADVVACLATRGKGHPSGISRLLGVSQKQVQDTLVEMAKSDLVYVRQMGRRNEYWLDSKRWLPFLFGQEDVPIQWIDWRALARGLGTLWLLTSTTSQKPMSDYVASSVARKAMRDAREDLLTSGIGVDPKDDRPYRSEAYLDVFVADMEQIAERLVGAGSVGPLRGVPQQADAADPR